MLSPSFDFYNSVSIIESIMFVIGGMISELCEFELDTYRFDQSLCKRNLSSPERLIFIKYFFLMWNMEVI